MSRSKQLAARKIAGAASELATQVEQPAQIDPHGVLALYRSGKVREAGKRARKLMRKYPDALILYDILTAALAGEGKLAEAAACCRRALKINPHHLDAHSNLGAILRKLGKIEEAALSYCRALAIDPGRAETLNNLGNVLSELGRFDEAAASYARAFRATPSSLETLSRFAGTLQRVSNVDAPADFKDLIVLCFEHSSIASTSVRPISHRLLKSDLQEIFAADTFTSSDLVDLNPSTDGLLAAHLNRSLIADTDLELFLCRVRGTFLDLRSQCDLAALADGTALPLLRSLAYQGFLNEYLWHVTEEENSCIEALEAEIAGVVQSGGAPGEIDLYLLAAYRPLYEIECIKCWALKHCGEVSAELKRFLRDVILDLDRERDIGRQIGRLTSIEDDVSMAVRAQYEENPYPRWNSLSVDEPRPYTEQILRSVAPHKPALEQTSPAPDVLVAGCGTGRHPITTALGYRHSNVLAVDLSRASLAFAQRKANELKVSNIRFAQADILKLGQLEDSFDIIECVGVLHHMASPEVGLKLLLERLKPGGFLRLGLYSELARQSIVRMRQLVSEMAFEPTLEGIRAFRHFVRESENADIAALRQSNDFYATSAIRDLVFHVQEHRFTIPQVSRMLHDHNLEFMGFMLTNPLARADYLKQFPDDPDCTNLQNWHQFEQCNPNTFARMYQFWCQYDA